MKEYKPRHALDRSLNSGERQVSVNPQDIDKWHVWRYEEAAKLIKDGETVVDFGCGIGYGTKRLAAAGKYVLGIDDSTETIEFARKHYLSDNIGYINAGVQELKGLIAQHDVGVAFEILEHLEKPEEFLEMLGRTVKRLLVLSVPHITVDIEKSDFHYRHYTEDEIVTALHAAGFVFVKAKTMMFSKGAAVFCVCEK